QDCPQGDYVELRARGLRQDAGGSGGLASFRAACAHYRLWLLFVTYRACRRVDLFIHHPAAVQFVDRLHLSPPSAGIAAASFGLLALFARALGGWLSDRLAGWRGLDMRVTLLFVLMIGEGLGLLAFAMAGHVGIAVVAMLVFGLFTHMACGATYA